jgi:hypothetical protein
MVMKDEEEMLSNLVSKQAIKTTGTRSDLAARWLDEDQLQPEGLWNKARH